MNKVLLDTSILLELLIGGQKANAAKQYLCDKELFTTSLNIYEVFYRIKEDAGEEKAEEKVHQLSFNIAILPVEARIAIDAGRMRAYLRKMCNSIGAVDVLTYAVARSIDAQLITGDPDFKGLKGVTLL